MTQEQITEGNKLIAFFMGAKELEHSTDFIRFDNVPDGNLLRHASGLIAPMWLEYHSSWDWLMPVVEKIESLGHQIVIVGGDSVWGNYCNIMTNISLVEASLENPSKFVGKSDSKHESVFSAVVQFIKWYNTQSK